MSEIKDKGAKAKKKKPTLKAEVAILRKALKELTARVVALEAGDTSTPVVEAAGINKVSQHNGKSDVTLREKSRIEMDDYTFIASVRNAAAVLPPNEIDPELKMHTLGNLQAICGGKVTAEIRQAAYCDPQFRIYLKEFGLPLPVFDEE